MVREITKDELKDMMDSGESFVLVNVLDPDSFENEHICGSINIPASTIARDALEVLNKDDTVILHCSGPECTASKIAAEKLDTLGFSDVWRFKGGIEEWKGSGYCVEGLAYRGKAA
ncbi:MAG TPA: rhodanese-like domain-containing protein [Thermodesulfobacteriota bacterium]